MTKFNVRGGISDNHLSDIKRFTRGLNNKNSRWKLTFHAKSMLSERFDEINIIKYINGIKLKTTHVFEWYYKYDNSLEKVCYCLPYGGDFIVIVCLRERVIVTLYFKSNISWLNNLQNIWKRGGSIVNSYNE